MWCVLVGGGFGEPIAFAFTSLPLASAGLTRGHDGKRLRGVARKGELPARQEMKGMDGGDWKI